MQQNVIVTNKIKCEHKNQNVNQINIYNRAGYI